MINWAEALFELNYFNPFPAFRLTQELGRGINQITICLGT